MCMYFSQYHSALGDLTLDIKKADLLIAVYKKIDHLTHITFARPSCEKFKTSIYSIIRPVESFSFILHSRTF